MSSITLNGARTTAIEVTIPHYGAWTGDVTLSGSDAVSESARLVIGDLDLKSTVVRQGSFGGETQARLVGGYAGWRKPIAARPYQLDNGLQLSMILKDAATDCGEVIEVASDRKFGTAWIRTHGLAEETLSLLLDGAWWIDTDGSTQTKARNDAFIVSPFTVISHLGARGQFEIASEFPSHWMPGRKFSGPTVLGVQVISSVTITADNDGKVRIIVLVGLTGADRLKAALKSIIQAELIDLNYSKVWEYIIASGTLETVDVTSTDSRVPDQTNVPMMAGLLGETVLPTEGAKCRIRFVNGDPKRPECIGIIGATKNSNFDVSSGVFKVNGGADFAALAEKVNDSIELLRTAHNTSVYPTPWGPTLVASVQVPPQDSVACVKLKTD